MQSCEVEIILKHSKFTEELCIPTVSTNMHNLFIIFLKGKYYIKAKLVWPITEIICCAYFSVFQKQVFLVINISYKAEKNFNSFISK